VASWKVECLVISSFNQLTASSRAASGVISQLQRIKGSVRLFDLYLQRIRCFSSCSVILPRPPLTTELFTMQTSLASRSSLQSLPFLPPRTPRRLFPLSVAALSPSAPAKLLGVVSARQRPWLLLCSVSGCTSHTRHPTLSAPWSLLSRPG
jgi:hypothetical protein